MEPVRPILYTSSVLVFVAEYYDKKNYLTSPGASLKIRGFRARLYSVASLAGRPHDRSWPKQFLIGMGTLKLSRRRALLMRRAPTCPMSPMRKSRMTVT